MTTDTTATTIPAPFETRPIEVTTPIRPSEAIRLGCLIAPVQKFGGAHYVADNGAACVVGAGMLGMGYRLPDGPNDFEDDLQGSERDGKCPVDDCGDSDVSILAIHLNDDHRWSRERIADWLEGLGL